MERVRLTEFGWEHSLVTETMLELPHPTGQQVLIDVEACGICHLDLITREGRLPFVPLPVTLGHEAVGRITKIGDDVSEFSVGDRVGTLYRETCGECSQCTVGDESLCEAASHVLGVLADGGYASQLLMPQSGLFRVPESLPPEHAAQLHCPMGTTYRDLKVLAGVRRGQRVLVTGANGGCGAAGVQIASRLGAEVIAVVRDSRHVESLLSLGASRVVGDPGSTFHKNPAALAIDVVLDTVGPPTFNSSLRCLRRGGTLVVIGNVDPERVSVNLGYLVTSAIRVIGGSGATRAEVEELCALHEESPFQFLVASVFPFSEADQAQRKVKAGGLCGRVVLVPSPTA